MNHLPPPHIRSSRLVVALLFAVGACSIPTEHEASVSSVVRLDVRHFPEVGDSGVTVADTLVLTVRPAKGDDIARRVPLAGRGTVSLPITIPTGRTITVATIISDNQTALYQGVDTTDVKGSGSGIRVHVTPVAPVLAVYPESLPLKAGSNPDTFRVINRGLDSLTWTVDTMAGFTPTRVRTTVTGVTNPGLFIVACSTTVSKQVHVLTIRSSVKGVVTGSVGVRVAVQ